MHKIALIGAGSFGTALGVVLGDKGYEVNIWGRNQDVINEINMRNNNKRYLPNIDIPKNVVGYTNLKEALDDVQYVVLTVSSQSIREVCIKIREYINSSSIIINMAKGIEENSYKRLSTVIKEELPNNKVVVLSGPSHAEEVARRIPTTMVAASEDMESALKVQDLFMTEFLRVYTNSDLIGVEIGGAVKNIIALAAGISDGIGCGDNSKAALMTRSISEMMRIGIKLGGDARTFSGLTGIGDLIVTCTSVHSRNRRAGLLIGRGMPIEAAIEEVGMVVEGITACTAFYHLKEREGVYMPITDMLYKILFENKNLQEAVIGLMTKDKKNEMY
jgi:glycerol-3-phosphate dehydrogenase (NAD(P)+)